METKPASPPFHARYFGNHSNRSSLQWSKAERTYLPRRSLVGFALGQVLILPLAPGLTGDSERSESVDQVASQLLALIQSASVVG